MSRSLNPTSRLHIRSLALLTLLPLGACEPATEHIEANVVAVSTDHSTLSFDPELWTELWITLALEDTPSEQDTLYRIRIDGAWVVDTSGGTADPVYAHPGARGVFLPERGKSIVELVDEKENVVVSADVPLTGGMLNEMIVHGRPREVTVFSDKVVGPNAIPQGSVKARVANWAVDRSALDVFICPHPFAEDLSGCVFQKQLAFGEIWETQQQTCGGDLVYQASGKYPMGAVTLGVGNYKAELVQNRWYTEQHIGPSDVDSMLLTHAGLTARPVCKDASTNSP